MIPYGQQEDGSSPGESEEEEQNGSDLAHSLSPYLSTAKRNLG
jgi:hypothetical protein